ncbi:threonine aldolase family protein [Albidovulum sediminicola]|uniref:L-threonine aldolase n=1 Tax=Albidovulum sediminicola TaxID=2984331 RepID=A0ABT2Z5Y0_9RHOB|nr:aminotransferase class I/II-fold pyridoxal phosphate-dependent enzyme [Defluviimonas sp. WL0075]MCV2866440.1 aminotransferase class I/II-fold pyridoxal phosphate-dependent enzyme [Defluviimonas sp. WL0075]
MEFRSDNNAGTSPVILDAVVACNAGPAASYGNDPIMDRVRDRIRTLFEAPDAEVALVATGTAANALALATFCPPWGAIYAFEAAHAEMDECGAPEFFTGGAKIRLVPGQDGKITPEALAAKIGETGQGDVHSVQRGMVTLTNITEAGTVYSAEEVAALAGVAKRFGLPVHLDGARFANAIVATGATPAEMTWKAGVDVLSFGGTKNGCMGVEAVVIFDPARAWELALRRKRAGHLFSKHRYLSAQMGAYLDGGLWLTLARHANDMAAQLEAGLRTLPEVTFASPRGANMQFVTMPRRLHQRAMEAGANYYLMPHGTPLDGDPDERVLCRLVTSWATTEAEVDGLIEALRA